MKQHMGPMNKGFLYNMSQQKTEGLGFLMVQLKKVSLAEPTHSLTVVVGGATSPRSENIRLGFPASSKTTVTTAAEENAVEKAGTNSYQFRHK